MFTAQRSSRLASENKIITFIPSVKHFVLNPEINVSAYQIGMILGCEGCGKKM